jgi:hypothetical protein
MKFSAWWIALHSSWRIDGRENQSARHTSA